MAPTPHWNPDDPFSGTLLYMCGPVGRNMSGRIAVNFTVPRDLEAPAWPNLTLSVLSVRRAGGCLEEEGPGQ